MRESRVFSDSIADALDLPGDGLRLGLIRALVFALFVVLWPLVILLKRRLVQGSAALLNRCQILWEETPYEAVALLRMAYDRLITEQRAGRLKPVIANVAVPPFGWFSELDLMRIIAELFWLEASLGHHEEALSLFSGMPEVAATVGLKANCLVRLGRHPEAIALLEQNLHLDNRAGELRRRLDDLVGNQLRKTN